MPGAVLRDTEGRVDHAQDAVRRRYATSADVVDAGAPGRERAVHAPHRPAISQLVQSRRRRRATGDLPQAARGERSAALGGEISAHRSYLFSPVRYVTEHSFVQNFAGFENYTFLETLGPTEPNRLYSGRL